MKAAPNKRLVLARERLEKVSQQIDHLAKISRKDIEEVAEKYSKQNSSVLAGIAGGVVGAGAGISVASALGGVVVIGGPAGLLLGAALAVLMWRGKGYQRIERATEQTRMALDEVRRQISDMQDAPDDVRRELWDTHKACVRRYRAIVLDALSEGEKRFGSLDQTNEGIQDTAVRDLTHEST